MATFNSLKPVAASLGLAVAAGALAVSVPASAEQNPFATQSLSAGYQLSAAEGRCGEGKCGSNMKADKEDKLHKEGSCGAQGKAQKEGKCGEGKCGEGKCGSDMKADKEGSCGAQGKAQKDKKNDDVN